ncbi:prominin-like protein [Drosophila busckii]|uniref:prominin-like protein n=1 Tax=Drosophila busckii TaxID=30019 RepID=UPI00083F0A5A|nr:prominin-like protein [Drosophila busckii]
MLETKSKQKRYWNRIRKRRGSQKPEHTVNGFTVIAFGILLILFVQHTQADSGNSSENGFRDTLEGHDTIHEQMGQEHFAAPDLTEYNGTVTYTTEPKRSAMGLKPVYNLTHKILKTFIFGDPALPSGYLMVVKKDALALGAKSEEDNWQELVSHYWSLLIFIWIMLLLIIGMPFIAVCYLCFCCCRRCTPGCPPCTMQRDICLHMIYSSILLVLVIFIIIFAVIVSLANRVLERGFKETSETLKRGSKDTCSFLQDVSDHIHHLLIFNYEELHAHLMDILNYGDNHILLDVADASQGNALSTLEKILDNMPEARILMRQVNILEKNIRFYGAQMRDDAQHYDLPGGHGQDY